MDSAPGSPRARVLREPLLHFLLIGIAVFAFHRIVAPPEAARAERVVEVTQAQTDSLAAQFEAVWRRPPGAAELASLVDNYVREEIYYREALALGLDRDDTVIRRRLQQKMEFLSDAGAEALTPDEAELKAYLEANIDRYTPPARIDFRQILLDGADAAAILARLAEGADPLELGRATLLPASMEDAPPATVDGSFGQGFFAALAALKPGAWTGPVNSAFGQHLVQVIAFEPAAPPPLDAVRSVVEEDWRREAAEAQREARYRLLRDSYEVVTTPAPAP